MKLLDTSFLDGIDVITWAPVSFLRRFNRGYDQAELIAVALGKELGIPVKRLLKKQRHTRAQSTLNGASERKANIQGAYRAINIADIPGKNILLVDDVLTTGATSNECARILKTAGAESICLATVAVTTHSNQTKQNERR
ncbi:MAG: ComF family protein [Oscillospiraceae bacterium]|nr:ComF family protein [Oscillospiraceae bacterium]